MEFAKGASGFRLFAAMVENDLVVTSNPAKFASPVREQLCPSAPFYLKVYRSIVEQTMKLLQPRPWLDSCMQL